MNMKKRNIKNALAAFLSATLVALAAVALVSCDNELDGLPAFPAGGCQHRAQLGVSGTGQRCVQPDRFGLPYVQAW